MGTTGTESTKQPQAIKNHDLRLFFYIQGAYCDLVPLTCRFRIEVGIVQNHFRCYNTGGIIRQKT